MTLETARTHMKAALKKINADQTTVAICLNLLESVDESARVETLLALTKSKRA